MCGETHSRSAISVVESPLQDQPRDVLLPVGQPVGGHQQRRDPGRVGSLGNDGDTPSAARLKRRAVEKDPPALGREDPRDRHLARRPLALRRAQRAPRDRQDR